MPIIDLQRRLRQAGRIRIGESVPSRSGTGKQPRKLVTFKLTSTDRVLIDAAAAAYGGTVEPWEEVDGQWQVKTPAESLDVIVPPTEMAFSQWYELWDGGQCARRCDGRWNVLADRACACNPDNRDCDTHTRLSVILRALPGIGVWRLDTTGYYAAAELLGAVELIQGAAVRGGMLPARLFLDRREQLKEINGKTTKVKYVVPVLDIDAPVIQAIAGAAVGELTGPGPAVTPVPDQRALDAPSIADQMTPAPPPPPRANAAAPIRTTGVAPRTAAQRADAAPPAPGPSPQDPPSPARGDAAGSTPGPGPDATQSASGPPGDLGTDDERTGRAQTIARWSRSAGLDTDQARHDFLAAYSLGAYSSGKDAPVDALPGIREALKKLGAGELRVLTAAGSPPALVKASDHLVATKAGDPPDPGPTLCSSCEMDGTGEGGHSVGCLEEPF